MNKKKRKILIVDDEKANIIALTHILGDLYTIYAAKNGADAIESAKHFKPDVILLDILMPGMDGYEVIKKLKDSSSTRLIPVIFITGLGDTDYEERGLALGAADYISKPFKAMVVRLRIRNQIQILEQIEMIRQLSVTDYLTGVANRRDFDRRLELEWNHALRSKSPLSVLMLDIDDFKQYNDKYGHLQGDAALIEVARIIQGALNRSVDFVARWGGEEFAVLLPLTDLNGAKLIAEKIRATVEETPILTVLSEPTHITVSIGVYYCLPELEDGGISVFVDKVDQALYLAKQKGKNIISEAV